MPRRPGERDDTDKSICDVFFLRTNKEVAVRLRTIAGCIAVYLWLGLAVSQVQAGNLILTYDALTGAGGSVDGTPIGSGVSYEIQVVFSSSLVSNPAKGVGV